MFFIQTTFEIQKTRSPQLICSTIIVSHSICVQSYVIFEYEILGDKRISKELKRIFNSEILKIISDFIVFLTALEKKNL